MHPSSVSITQNTREMGIGNWVWAKTIAMEQDPSGKTSVDPELCNMSSAMI